MKTHFTADDIGKTFATSQEGVTAKMIDFILGNVPYPYQFVYSNDATFWCTKLGTAEFKMKRFNVHPDKEILPPSEADLLRKEIEELKASHEADLRTAVEMARAPDLIQDKELYMYTPDEIIEKILKK
jgi:hypothetical protein